MLEKFVLLYVFDSFPPFFMPKSKSLTSLLAHLLFFKERLEQLAPVSLYKRATVSNSLRSLITTERRERVTLWLTKNEPIACFFFSAAVLFLFFLFLSASVCIFLFFLYCICNIHFLSFLQKLFDLQL